MKNAKLIGSILAILASAGYLTYSLRSEPAPGAKIAHRQAVACTACGKTYDGMLGDPPGDCAACGKTTAWPAAKCFDCAAIFAEVREKDAAFGTRAACPKCGKSNYGDVPPGEVSSP